MVRAIYTAASGMALEARKQDLVSSNLFYAQSPGFKAASFLRGAEPTTSQPSRTDVQTVLKGQFVDPTTGALRPTRKPLDLALEGDGLFAVETKGGIAYTRDGRFTRYSDNVVRDGNGNALLGEKGPIRFPSGAKFDAEVKVQPDGTFLVGGTVVDKLRLADFPGFRGLQAAGGSYFYPTGAVTPTPSTAAVTQGVLEDSNVSGVGEMVRMMETTRAFESYQKMVQTIDEATADSVRRLGRLA